MSKYLFPRVTPEHIRLIKSRDKHHFEKNPPCHIFLNLLDLCRFRDQKYISGELQVKQVIFIHLLADLIVFIQIGRKIMNSIKIFIVAN